MFVTQKMILLDVLVLQKDIEDVSQLIVESGYFEPSSYSSVVLQGEEKEWTLENTTDKKKMITTLYKEAQDLQLFFDPHHNQTVGDTQRTIYPIPSIGEMIRQYSLKKTQLEERSYRIRKQKEDVAIKIAGLRMHMDTHTKKSTSRLDQSEDLYSVLGLVTTGNLSVLQNEFHRFEGELLTEGHVNDSEIVFITIPKDKKSELSTLLEQLYFVNYGLPEEFFGEGTVNMMQLGLEFTLVCDQEEMLESEINKYRPAVLTNLKDIFSSLDLYTKMSEVRQSMKRAGHFVLLSGWITADKYRKFIQTLEKLCGNNYELTITDTDVFQVEVHIPTKLNNPKIFKPFEQLVTTFGMPNYKEIDPTILFASLYFFMYGAMFGDVGQGAVMFLLGLLGVLFKRKSSFVLIFSLMVWVGISSMIFGVLYGSYFGYESMYYDWVPEPYWISPMHNIETIFLYA
ncbi:MAG: V-type ATPase 116kDa subunit family protein, partial [Brevinema sp.]